MQIHLLLDGLIEAKMRENGIDPETGAEKVTEEHERQALTRDNVEAIKSQFNA